MEIGYFKAMELFGMLSDELTKAAEDGLITGTEALNIVQKICNELDLEFDREK